MRTNFDARPLCRALSFHSPFDGASDSTVSSAIIWITRSGQSAALCEVDADVLRASRLRARCD
jgi:hypothetical protein